MIVFEKYPKDFEALHEKPPDRVTAGCRKFWIEIPAGHFLKLLTFFKVTTGAKDYILCVYLGMLWYIMNHWY